MFLKLFREKFDFQENFSFLPSYMSVTLCHLTICGIRDTGKKFCLQSFGRTDTMQELLSPIRQMPGGSIDIFFNEVLFRDNAAEYFNECFTVMEKKDQ